MCVEFTKEIEIMDKRIAIIDLGSNSIRMNIINISSNGAYYLVDQSKEMVRLSEKMGPEKILKDVAIERTIKTIKIFDKLIETYRVEKVWAIATAAVRSAKNKEYFINKVREETGHDIKVVDGNTEAYYDYLGVINTIDVKECLIVDIGGASTELVYVKDRNLIESISLPFGSVTLSENNLKYSNSKKSIEGLKAFFEEKLSEITWLKDLRGIEIVGLGGSIRNIARIHKAKNNDIIPDLHNYKMGFKDIRWVLDKIVDSSYEEISEIKGISKSRIDIMAGGLVPIYTIMKFVRSGSLTVSGSGLREGVFFEKYLSKRENILVLDSVLEHSLSNIGRKYKINTEHGIHVKNIALSLFEELADIHGIDEKYKKILYVASLLHDIGMHVEYYNHHVHGFYLALNSRINGLDTDEIVSVAFLIGLHRDTKLRVDTKEYKEIVGKKEYKILKKIALFLRIAEKLDRGEFGNIKSLYSEIDDKKIKLLIEAYGSENIDLEISQALEYKDTFKKYFGYELEIVSK